VAASGQERNIYRKSHRDENIVIRIYQEEMYSTHKVVQRCSDWASVCMSGLQTTNTRWRQSAGATIGWTGQF